MRTTKTSKEDIQVAPLVGARIEITLRCPPGRPKSSLPSWERGLKSEMIRPADAVVESLPSWERGLKYVLGVGLCGLHGVAPLVGARIEIGFVLQELKILVVAPLVGARIEIISFAVGSTLSMSLPSWERGLK